MNAEQIAARLRGAGTHDEAMLAVRDIDPRRQELRALIDAATAPASHLLPVPPRRAKAAAEGPAALAALDRDIEALRRELDHLEEVERSGYERAETLKIAATRAAAPRARSALPKACKRVREAVAELDAALAALRVPVEALGGIAALSGEAFPLSDEETAALLELRELVWTVRHVAVLVPPETDEASAEFPRSHAAMFERSGGPGNTTVRRRSPPQRIADPTEFGEATFRQSRYG